MTEAVLRAIRDLIQQDPGGRGLATDPAENLLTTCADDFAAACHSLARDKTKVLIITGFPIVDARPPCSETDGPAGALFLARALAPLGIEVLLAADGTCAKALEIGVRVCDLQDRVTVIELPMQPLDDEAYIEWVHAACDRTAAPLTHLLAIERVGPSHTMRSIKHQTGWTPDTVLAFEAEVPVERRDRSQSMRGLDLTGLISPTHLLFERARFQDPPWTTIGIGDGGNELGMGKIPWDIIRRNVEGSGPIACRVATDHLIVAGISNWGAYGLATGVRLVRQAPLDPALYDAERERDLLQLMIYAGPLVDGRTRRKEPTVDGLPFDRSAEVLKRLGEIEAGFHE